MIGSLIGFFIAMARLNLQPSHTTNSYLYSHEI